MTLLVIALVVGWIALSVPVALAIGRASALAAERDAERQTVRSVVELPRREPKHLRRAA
jgi:uncharacterized membrane protein